MYEIGRDERAQLAKFLDVLVDRRARLLQQQEDIDAVLAEIDGVERECRRRLKDEGAPRRRRRDAARRRPHARCRGRWIDVYVNVIDNRGSRPNTRVQCPGCGARRLPNRRETGGQTAMTGSDFIARDPRL